MLRVTSQELDFRIAAGRQVQDEMGGLLRAKTAGGAAALGFPDLDYPTVMDGELHRATAHIL
jgi:hypothetical protein